VIARAVGVIEDQLRRNDVTVIPGDASFVDSHTLAVRTEAGAKMLFHRETRRLLAVHCVGTGATELVHVGRAALEDHRAAGAPAAYPAAPSRRPRRSGSRRPSARPGD